MRLSIIYLVFSFLIFYASESAFAGADDIGVTDSASMQLYSFFDLRDRDSFVQITNTANSNQVVHIQIFNVMDNCNENNFYDTYTGSDTHTYNLRNIITNDGNLAGVVLPGDAFGIVVATTVLGVGENSFINQVLIGNSRIIDILGYEYRSNLIGIQFDFFQPEAISTFNFSQQAGTALSDFVGIALHDTGPAFPEVRASDALNVNMAINVDIYNNDEVVFSCRDVVFACVKPDNPLNPEIIENIGIGNVVSLEYGINDAIPHSRGGEVLCPGNNISEGFVRFNCWAVNADIFVGYIGLNNGNNRGSMDGFITQNTFIAPRGG